MKTRITVLGGSSPFTASLIDALASAVALSPCELVLHGRNLDNLQAVTQYGQHVLGPLGWTLSFHCELPAALDGAAIVVHQIRYGDMTGRDEDEKLALQFGLPPDETLGPGALYTILRSVDDLRQTSAELVRVCPDAWVLNLTNPLSLVTSLMIDAGVSQCVGLCELPLVTAGQAADLLSLSLLDVDWSYVGLNHRGFITQFDHRGVDQIPVLAERLSDQTLGDITADTVAQLHAIPTKYFRLVTGDTPPQAGRATFLSALRDKIALELRHHPEVSPSSLNQRYLEWYPQSVVPMIDALLSAEPSRQIVNMPSPNGLVEEGHAWVSSACLDPVPSSPTSPEVEAWLKTYRLHEQVLLQAVRDPSLDTIRQALQADPVVPPVQVDSLANAIWDRYQVRASSGLAGYPMRSEVK